MLPMSTFIGVIGVIGAVALLIVYCAVSLTKLSPDGPLYQSVNFAGAFALAVNSGYHGAWPSAVLNVVWCAIGALTLGRFVASRAKRRSLA